MSQQNENDPTIEDDTSKKAATAASENNALSGSFSQVSLPAVSQSSLEFRSPASIITTQPSGNSTGAPQQERGANTPESPFSIISTASIASESTSASAAGFVIVGTSPGASLLLNPSETNAVEPMDASTSSPASADSYKPFTTKPKQEPQNLNPSTPPQFTFGNIKPVENPVSVDTPSKSRFLFGKPVGQIDNDKAKQPIHDSAIFNAFGVKQNELKEKEFVDRGAKATSDKDSTSSMAPFTFPKAAPLSSFSTSSSQKIVDIKNPSTTGSSNAPDTGSAASVTAKPTFVPTTFTFGKPKPADSELSKTATSGITFKFGSTGSGASSTPSSSLSENVQTSKPSTFGISKTTNDKLATTATGGKTSGFGSTFKNAEDATGWPAVSTTPPKKMFGIKKPVDTEASTTPTSGTVAPSSLPGTTFASKSFSFGKPETTSVGPRAVAATSSALGLGSTEKESDNATSSSFPSKKSTSMVFSLKTTLPADTEASTAANPNTAHSLGTNFFSASTTIPSPLPKATSTSFGTSKPKDNESSTTAIAGSSFGFGSTSSNASGSVQSSTTGFGISKGIEHKAATMSSNFGFGPGTIGMNSSTKIAHIPKTFTFGSSKVETTGTPPTTITSESAGMKSVTDPTSNAPPFGFSKTASTSAGSTFGVSKSSSSETSATTPAAQASPFNSALTKATEDKLKTGGTPAWMLGTAKDSTGTAKSASPAFTFGAPQATKNDKQKDGPAAFTFGAPQAAKDDKQKDGSAPFTFGPKTTTASVSPSLSATAPIAGGSSLGKPEDGGKTSANIPVFSFGKQNMENTKQKPSGGNVSSGSISTSFTPAIPLFGSLPESKPVTLEAIASVPGTSAAKTDGGKEKSVIPSLNFGIGKPVCSSTNASKPTLPEKAPFTPQNTEVSATSAAPVPSFSFGAPTTKKVDGNVTQGLSTGVNGVSTANTASSISTNAAKDNLFSLDRTIADMSNAAYQPANQIHASLITPSLAGLQLNQIVCHTNFRIDNIMPATRVADLPQQAQQELDEFQRYIRTEIQQCDYMLRDDNANNVKSLDKTGSDATSLSNLRYAVDAASVIEACKHPGRTSQWLFGHGVDDDFFNSLATQLQGRVEEYKKCIWEIERTAESWMQNKAQSPDDIARIMRCQNQTFLALSGKVAILHEELQLFKKHYRQYVQMHTQ
ncbi:hypothetical protein DFQ29_000590 [Apophysomyces sp. BC1021]|nr:hypothetical protein DFQ29_000590 [Apophysomyces sp. BC1021]